MLAAYLGGVVRPENRPQDRKDRRRVVVALRERAGRTPTFIRNREGEGAETAGACRVADAKLALEADYASTRINHSVSYGDGHRKHTNMVES
ncbi:hypothetical protein LCM4576_00440 [Mesorhizobium sp. LCM 4576]|uniref:hypothetical protein n=1 Tax=Mesorhizobium sp. LCM 4576 TaxID=1848289 RepID=UPI000678B70D|nr:hypothetical protein LCM4576_00440 [Mesorhizobium sp. LCM 4576]